MIHLRTETKNFINNALSIYTKTIVDITSNSEAKAIAFLESIPILDVETTLITLRNMQHDREIHENDWADLNALVVAVPYCDIVITEKFFHNLTVRSKLDKKYNTIVLRNLNDLLHHL